MAHLVFCQFATNNPASSSKEESNQVICNRNVTEQRDNSMVKSGYILANKVQALGRGSKK